MKDLKGGTYFLKMKDNSGLEDKELIEKIARLYIKSASLSLAEIDLLIENRDTKNLKLLVHKVKSSSALIGAQKVYDACLQFELDTAEAQDFDWVAVQHDFIQIKKEMRSAIADLRELYKDAD